MNLSKILKNGFLVFVASIMLTACATQKKVGQTQGDVYTGSDSVEYLASGVKDRVFFATNETVLTTASRETLRKQAAWLRKNSKITLTSEFFLNHAACFLKVSLEAVVSTVSFVAKKTLSGTPLANSFTVSVPV